MHLSLTSREQDLDASPVHQRLMANLGSPLLKSQAHADALHGLLRRDNNHDHRAPANPAAVIRRASPDMTLTPAQRKRAHREDSRQEAEKLRRMSEARTNGGVVDEDEEMIDGVPVSPCSLSKGHHAGAFSRLRLGLHSFMKAQPRDYDEAQFRADMQRMPVVKPATGEIVKAVEMARTTTAKALGMKEPNNRMQALGKSMATLAKSLGNTAPARPVAGQAHAGNRGRRRSEAE
jgi:hypothetical protein